MTISQSFKKKQINKIYGKKKKNLPNSQLSFNIPHSKYQSKLYKIFYFNENRNKWIFDKKSFEQFSNDKKITVEFANTPLVCFIDSNEKDLISINSHFINGNYPNLNEILIAFFLFLIYRKKAIKNK